MTLPHLWGKSQEQLQAERQEMIARREYIARRDAAAKTPAALGKRYGQALQPVRREYHFGTDIPRPTWREVEDARARTGRDDAGGPILGMMAISAVVLALAWAILYLALT